MTQFKYSKVLLIGIARKFNLLKHIIKHHPHRHLKPRYTITGKTKKELIDYIESNLL